jgi:phosphate transport system substrate-binding protein
MKMTLALMLSLVAALASAQDWSWAGKDSNGFVTVNPSRVVGSVLTSGSSTVYPIAQMLVDQFRAEGFGGQLAIDNIGTGAGLKRFATGEVDFANASRPILPAERKAAESRGKVLEFKLALDAIVLLVSSQNTWVKDLDDEAVQAAFAEAEKWSDINPSWPAEKIRRYIPETSHGTFDFFQEHFWDDKGVMLKSAPDVQRFQDFNRLTSAVQGDKYGIGFVGYAYYKDGDARAVKFNGMLADRNTVESRTYGLSRYLYTYVNARTLTTKAQSAAYLGFVLNNVSKVAARVGYFPLPAAELAAQKKLLSESVAGKF